MRLPAELVAALIVIAALGGNPLANGVAHATAATTADVDPASVYRIDPRIDGAIILTGAAATVLPYAFADRIIDTRCPCDPAEVHPWDRGVIGRHSGVAGFISDIVVGGAVLAPVAIDLWGQRRPYQTLIEDLTVYAEVLAVNGALVTLVKNLVQRPLPRTYEGEQNLVDTHYGYRAFYSGHTAVAFAAMSAGSMTAGLRYGHRWMPWVLTVAAGATVAAGRVLGGYHFYSDVVVGAAAGTAVGITIPLLHRRPRERPGVGGSAAEDLRKTRDAAKTRWAVIPRVQMLSDGAALLLHLSPR